MKNKYRKVKKYRTRLSRFLAILAIIALIFGKQKFILNPIAYTVIDIVALLLCTSAVMGRIWCSFYISGFKNKKLVSEGPYSMMRNPLYYFSFLGLIGVGLVSHSLLFFAFCILAFAFYYPLVIAGEEAKLSGIYGEQYDKYRSTVPKFFPKFSLFHQPQEYSVKPKTFYKDLRDCSMFIIVYCVMILINVLKAEGIIKAFFDIF